MTESFAELFEQSLSEKDLRPGAIVMGRVVEIRDDVVVINAGLKSEGIVPIHQFERPDGELEVAVGDEVEVSLDAVEDGFGETRLSREKAKRSRVWTVLEKSFDAEENVIGQISGKVKGGFTVNIDGIRAFLPGSLVDVRPVRDPGYLEGKDLEFKIIKLDRRRNNLVVSRRAVVEHEYAAERDDLIERLTEGAVIKGVVKNLTDYGAFLDLGGIDGLLHITDMAWKRVRHPSEVVEVGDELEVRVLRFDRERMRVSLGLKQLGDDPWSNIDRRYPPTSRLFGKVTNITDYGCFVEIEDGVEGLVHVSEMDWTNKNVNPAKVVHVGQEVEVMVLDVDEERRRISLGMKQCAANPWEAFAATHNKGDKVSGAIKSITDFGIFIGLDGGIDGPGPLVRHFLDDAGRGIHSQTSARVKSSKLSCWRWTRSASVFRWASNRWSRIRSPLTWPEHPRGSIVNGKIKSVDPRGAIVELADGVDGYIKASDLAKERVEDATKVVSEGDTIEAKFVALDRKTRNLTLSIRAKDDDELAACIGSVPVPFRPERHLAG